MLRSVSLLGGADLRPSDATRWRTGEIIRAVGQLQIVEVTLGELHLVVLADASVLVVVDNILQAGSGVDGDVTNDGVLLVIPTMVACSMLNAGQPWRVTALEPTNSSLPLLSSRPMPTACLMTDTVQLAGVALDGAISSAQSAQQHLHERVAAQVPGRKVPSCSR